MKTSIHFNYTWADADESGNIGTSTFEFSGTVNVPALPSVGDCINFFPDDDTEGVLVRRGKVSKVVWVPAFSKTQDDAVLHPIVILEDFKDPSLDYDKWAPVREELIIKGRDRNHDVGKIIEEKIVDQGFQGGIQFYRCSGQT